MQNLTVNQLPNSEVEVRGSFTPDELAPIREKIIDEHQKTMELPGFRKGNVPREAVISNLGEEHLLQDAATEALSAAYPEIVQEHELKVISQPSISFTKLAPGNPVEFVLTVAVLPEFTLPDYDAVAKEALAGEDDDTTVTEDDVNEVLLEVRRGKARMERNKLAPNTSEEDMPPLPEDKDLPELDDEFVTTLGPFKSVAEFTDKVREDLAHRKAHQAKDKKRVAIVEALTEKTDIALPAVLVDAELNRMLAQFESEIERAGMKLDQYLGHIQKTMDDVRAEWKPEAEKRAKLQLILNKIAADEGIAPNPEDVERESKHILEHHKDADPESVKSYVTTMLTNEAVFNRLESGLPAQTGGAAEQDADGNTEKSA